VINLMEIFGSYFWRNDWAACADLSSRIYSYTSYQL